jgi:putative membrane protein
MADERPPGPRSDTARQVARQAEQVTESARNMEASAGAVEESAVQLTDSADRRTKLAADRTVLAAERTYAAWVRTGMAALASGVAVHPLLQHRVSDWVLMFIATLFIAFSILCFIAAVWRMLGSDPYPPKPDVRRLPAPLMIGANGMLCLAALAALGQIWFGRL